MIDVVTKRNCVYQTAYHVIWCPKYRRDVLIGAVASAPKPSVATLSVPSMSPRGDKG
ncbi:transposase [Aquaspirillum soli]